MKGLWYVTLAVSITKDSGVCTLSIIKQLICKHSYVQSYLHDHTADITVSCTELALNKTVFDFCQCLLTNQAVPFPTVYPFISTRKF